MIYEVEIYHEFHGNCDGYEIESDNFEDVLKEAKENTSLAYWFEISTKEHGLLWNGAMNDEYNYQHIYKENINNSLDR